MKKIIFFCFLYNAFCQVGFFWLQLPKSAVEAALSSTGICQNSLLNPATGVFEKPRISILMTHNTYLAGLNYSFLKTQLRFAKLYLGFDIFNLTSPKIKRRTHTGEYTGEFFSTSENFLSIRAGRRLKDFAVGWVLKYIQERLDDKKVSGFSLDLGILFKEKIFGADFGVAIRNIGGDLKFIQENLSLPLLFAVGFRYKLLGDGVVLLFDIEKEKQRNICIKGGVVAEIFKNFLVYLGYRSDKDIGIPISLGMSFSLRNIEFSFSYIAFSDLGDSKVFSICFKI